ncbi:MAG: hypothetical protein Q9160_006888 [Pyrenula sp. 1 TL-2023]
MHRFASFGLLIVGSVAANPLIPRTSCCFKLTAAGGATGPVGQLPDGQNRVGGNYPNGTYCIDNGEITDGGGRGCILTPPTTQFQCDSGAKPTGNLGINCDGTVTHDSGDSKFYACDSGSGLNIYTQISPAQTGCKEITLHADGCAPACPAPSCPKDLTGSWQFPHLIIPVSSSSPSRVFGTSYAGQVTPKEISSIFNFDVPSSPAYTGKTCRLELLLPRAEQMTTSSFTFTGPGNLDFAALKGPASNTTSFSDRPGQISDFGVVSVQPGNAYTIGKDVECPAGQAVAFQIASEDTSLSWFQDSNPCPIGLYVTVVE